MSFGISKFAKVVAEKGPLVKVIPLLEASFHVLAVDLPELEGDTNHPLTLSCSPAKSDARKR
jgi:hypothetical protein